MQKRPLISRIAAGALACAGALCALGAQAGGSYFAVVPVSGGGSVGQLRPVTMALTGAVPAIASVGVPYEFNLGALLSLDGPEGTSPSKVQWRVVSGALPAGLALTGDRISGVPTILTPPSPVVIQAEYQDGARTVGALASYSFQVLHPVSVSLDAGAIPPAYINQPYQVDLAQFLALDGPEGTTIDGVQWKVAQGTLPPGLALSSSMISGTPSTYSATPSSFTISASFGEASAAQGYSIANASIPLAQFSGYRAWQDGTFAKDCNAYRHPVGAYAYAIATGDGVYRLQPDGLAPFDARCDMTTDGGGWTVFQRRFDGSLDFYRGYAAYVAGFGLASGEHWLGLERTRILASGGKELRIDMGRYNGERAYAKYSTFALGAASTFYTLTVAGYSGTAGDSLATVHNGRAFTTYDNKEDTWTAGNCAVAFHGAWWYQQCHHSNLNGYYYGGPPSTYNDGGSWKTFAGTREYLTSTEMKLR